MASNSKILYRNGLFLSGASIASGNQVGDFGPEGLLEKNFYTDDFWRWTPNSYLTIDFAAAVAMESLCIDRRHTLVEGNTITVYLSNTGTDPGDADETTVITVQDYQVGQTIYQVLSGVEYQFARLEFVGSNPALDYQEIGWLFMGPEDDLDFGFRKDVKNLRPHVVRSKDSWLGNKRTQKRSEQFYSWQGTMDKIPRAELDDFWQPFNEYAVNMWGFIYLDDNRTAELIAEYTRLVQWINAASWELGRSVIDGEDSANDLFYFSMQMREYASAGASPIA